MKLTCIAAVIVPAIALAATACFGADKSSTGSPPTLAQKVRNLVTTEFGKADRDNDGTLDRAEAHDMPDVAEHFDQIDTDRNGAVSADEIKAYEKFAKNDKDANGSLDKNEARGWWIVSKNFDAIDTDSDGTVSLTEINAYMRAMKSRAAYTK